MALERFKSLKKDKRTIDNLFFTDKDIAYQMEIVSPINKVGYESGKKKFIALAIKNYQDDAIPYQGEITNASSCPKKFFPTIHKETKELLIIKYFTGATYVHRICEEKLVTASTCTSFHYDAKSLQSFKLTVSTKPAEDCIKPSVTFFNDLQNLN